MNYKELPLVKEIGEQYKEWNTGDSILIGASMGSGKTQFIIKVLADYAKENNKKILLISNRTALRNENDNNIKNNELEKNILSINYQRFQSEYLIKCNNGYMNTELLEMFDYIVCDECHYFLTDAWTEITDVSYDSIIQSKHPIKIFMSATYWEIFELLKEDIKSPINTYNIESDFSYINKIVFYKQQKYVEKLIESLPTNEKLIYFSRKLDIAYELHNKYKDNSSFVCSEGNKNYNEFITPNALNNNKLTNQLTFTSTTWDNGINIIDSDVKHVVIDIDEIVTFIQCLGRRRKLKNDNGFILYIRNWTNEELNRHSFDYRKEIVLYNKYKDNMTETLNLKRLNKIPDSKCMYISPETEKLTVNKLAFKNIQNSIKKYNKAMEVGWNNYIINILKIENVEYVDFDEEIKKVKISELELYLNNIVGVKLFSEEQHELSNLIIKEISGIKGKYQVRGKKLNPSTLEKILRDELNLKYAVSKPIQETTGKRRRYIIISRIVENVA